MIGSTVPAFTGEINISEVLLFFFAIVFTFILGSTLNVLLIRSLKDKARPFVYKTISKTVMYGVYISGILFAFNNIIHFNVTASLAALGVLGVALLLPTVPILQNIAAGVVIAFERPFHEEDIVEYGGELCKVKDIMLRKTKLRAFSGKIITVPNILFVMSQPVVNYTAGEFIKIALNIALSPTAEHAKVVETIQRITAHNPNILPNVPQKKISAIMRLFSIPKNFFVIPRNIAALAPKIFIRQVSGDKIDYEVWFWIWDITQKEKIISSFYEALISEFKKENIPFG